MRYRRGSSGGTKLRSIGIAFVIAALAATVLAAPAGAQAGATCDGQAATIVGTDGDDVLAGTEGADVIVGLGGNDRIDGLDGDDVICGDEGNDTIRAGRGEDTVLGGDGNDVIRGQQNADVIDGGEGNDTIRGNNGADTIFGRNGNDTLLGGKGRDEIRGGDGVDEIGGGNHDDTVFGEASDDVLRGGNGADFIDGGAGIDNIRGGIGVDQIFTGGTVGDEINTGDGDDFIDGIPEGQVAVAAGSFFYQDFGDETWTGEIYGLVDVGVDQFGTDEPGTCYLVVGEITPQAVFGPVSDRFSTPNIGVVADGEFFDFSSACDRSSAEALGYSWILDAEATSGTTIPFFQEVFIPEGRDPVTDIVVGNQFRLDEATIVPPVVLDSVPVPTGLQVGVSPTGPNVGVGATFEYTETFSDSSWAGEVTDVIDAPVSRFNDEPGRCFLVLGSLTPTQIEGVVSNRFDTPSVGLLIDGRYLAMSGGQCETADAENQGFGWILDAEVTVGTEYPFYATFFIPEAFVGDPSHVIVGRAADDAAVFEN